MAAKSRHGSHTRPPRGKTTGAAQAPAPTPVQPDAVPGYVVWACVIGAVLAAYLVRSWFPRAWNEVGLPSSIFYEGDTRPYLMHAAQLQEGVLVNNGVPFRPPGWPFVLRVFFQAMGYAPLSDRPLDPAALKTFMAGISALAVGASTLLAWRLSGYGAMLGVAVLAIFHFGHVVQGTVPNSEALYGLLLVVALLLAARWLPDAELGSRLERAEAEVRAGGRDRRTVRRRAAVLGAVAGAATLVRAEFALAAGLLVPFLWWGTGRRVSVVGVYALGFVALLTPTTIVHWRGISEFNAKFADRLPAPLSRFSPVTSYGGFNFAHAFHDDTDGTTNLDLLVRTPKDPEEEALVAKGQLDVSQPVSYDLYSNGYRIGLRWILEHPVAALELVWQKASITSGVLALGYLQDNRLVGVDGTRRRVDLVDPTGRWLWPIHFVLILVGVWALRRQPRTIWLLAIPLVTLAAAALLFFGYVRLGVAYIPVLWVLQGAALAYLAGRVPWPTGARPYAALAVAALVLVLLVIEAGGTRRARPLYIEGPQGPDGAPVRDATIQLLTSRPSR